MPRQRFELISIANEIGIGIFFTLGSIAFYFEALFTLGVTLFLIGSVELGTRPAIRFARESRSAGSPMDYLTRWPDF